jgi:hypothetical protein
VADNLTNLKSIKAQLLQSLADETLFMQANGGPKPTYSLDGESYQWTEWRTAVLEKCKLLNVLIQQEQPFQISSRGRP